MKILLVQETDWLKKGPHQQHHLMDRLSLKGYEVRVIDHELLWRSEGKRGLYSRREVFYNVSRVCKESGVTVVRPSLLKIPHLDYVSLVFSRKKEIDRQIKEFNPDVIVGLYILNAYMARRAAKKNNIPFIYYWIDVYHAQIPFKPYQPIGKIIEKRSLKNADKVVTINEKLKEQVIKMGANPKKTHVVRAGIDLERYDPNMDSSEIRREYGIKEDDSVLFFMGTLFNFSGLKEVALELAKIKDKKPDIKLLFVEKEMHSMTLKK